MRQVLLDRLDRLFASEPFLKGGGVDERKIDSAERALGVRFSEDYRKFLGTYGGALVGPYPVYGLTRAAPMDERLWSVLTVTRHFRDQSWPGAANSYVISTDHAGNPIGIDERGKVLSFDHDSGTMTEVAGDFAKYLERCLATIGC
jgi:cell wall assembly regulator SMI1